MTLSSAVRARAIAGHLSGAAPQSTFRNIHTSATRKQSAATATATTTPAHKTTDPTAFETHHRKISQPIDATNFVDNEFVGSSAEDWFGIHDPATNNLVSRAPQSTNAELRAAVESAHKAFPAWKATSLLARQQIMFKFVNLVRLHWDRLAASITLEQGKTFADAKGDVLRGLQVAETACGITTQLTGDVLDVAKDMETRTYREPLGVVAGICPFSKCRGFSLSCRHAYICRLSCYDSIMVSSSSRGYR